VPISKLANLALYYSFCCPERLATLTSSFEVGSTSHVPYHAWFVPFYIINSIIK
jgi:hypothetical protein